MKTADFADGGHMGTGYRFAMRTTESAEGHRGGRRWSGAGTAWQNGCEDAAEGRNGVRPLRHGDGYRFALRHPYSPW